MTTQIEHKRKPKAYPKGLSVSIQDWARNAFKNCENSYDNRMDCATAFALMQLSNGDNTNFIAFRYRMDDKEAIAIVTEAMGIEGMSLGMCSYIKFINMSDFCQSLVKHGCEMGIDVIAMRLGKDERVYFHSIQLLHKLVWTQNPAETIANHNRWMADNIVRHWAEKIYTEYTRRKKVPPVELLLEFFDEWSQYAEGDTSRIKEKLTLLKRQDIKNMLGGYPFGLNRIMFQVSFYDDLNEDNHGE